MQFLRPVLRIEPAVSVGAVFGRRQCVLWRDGRPVQLPLRLLQRVYLQQQRSL